jgi:hypothetical protein
MSEILESLFGSKERLRLLRFFLQNPDGSFDSAEIMRRNMLKWAKIRHDMDMFCRVKFILKNKQKSVFVYRLNQNFDFYPEMKNLIAKANVSPQCKGLTKIANLGSVKLAVISGVFINYQKSKADMILVGDDISKAKLNNLMNNLEAEIGKEVNFVLMTMEEFKYRLNMLDKFILEFLEGPHEEVINKIVGLKQFMAKRKL